MRRPRQRAPSDFDDRLSSLDTPLSDEIEIVPTRLPQPPRRSRALAMMRDGTQGVLFFDEETPSDTSDSDSLLSASREPEPAPRPTYVYGSRPLVRRETISSTHPVTPIRRSESFQQRPSPVNSLFNLQLCFSDIIRDGQTTKLTICFLSLSEKLETHKSARIFMF